MKITKKVDDTYRLLIPKEIRDIMGVHKGTKVDLSITEDNDMLVSIVKDIDIIKDDEEVVIPSLKDRIASKLVDYTVDKTEKCYKCGSVLEPGNRLKLNR